MSHAVRRERAMEKVTDRKMLPFPVNPQRNPAEGYGDTWLSELIAIVDDCLARAAEQPAQRQEIA